MLDHMVQAMLTLPSFDAHWRSLTHQEEDVQRGLRAALPRREGELAHPSFFSSFLQLQMSLPCAVSFPLGQCLA